MTDYRELRNLIMLLDAESESVRQQVEAELNRRTADLESFLYRHSDELAPERLFQLQSMLQSHRIKDVREDWLYWTREDDSYVRLEEAMSFLASFQSGGDPDEDLEGMLDQLVEDFLSLEENPDELALNRFLFQEHRLVGNRDNYYHPLNSNLCHVIRSGQGLPISLVIVYMLCGARMDMNVQGLSYPGHFYAKVIYNGEVVLIDCFEEGAVLGHQRIEALSKEPAVPFTQLLQRPPTTEQIVTRVLTNLRNAYYKAGTIPEYRLIQELHNDLQYYLKTGRVPSRNANVTTGDVLYPPGQVVRHRLYGYRGVVVDVDRSCQADDAWYLSNLTQPDRNQPWYHVLVDGSPVTTYPAQSNLEADTSEPEIRHPLLSVYFKGLDAGRYLRNDVPWQLPS